MRYKGNIGQLALLRATLSYATTKQRQLIMTQLILIIYSSKACSLLQNAKIPDCLCVTFVLSGLINIYELT